MGVCAHEEVMVGGLQIPQHMSETLKASFGEQCLAQLLRQSQGQAFRPTLSGPSGNQHYSRGHILRLAFVLCFGLRALGQYGAQVRLYAGRSRTSL